MMQELLTKNLPLTNLADDEDELLDNEEELEEELDDEDEDDEEDDLGKDDNNY